MDLPKVTSGQVLAVARHAGSYVAGGVTVAIAFHYLSPAQGADVNQNVGLVVSGFMQIVTGVTGLIATLTPIYMAWMAARSSSPAKQAEALTKAVPGTTVIGPQELADATPTAPNVLSSATMKVVQK